MLHIITPLYRPNNLKLIWESIPKHTDITWHISKSNKTEKLNFNFLNEDNRIKIYEVDCDDNEAFKKRRSVLENIKDGYFCFLDDDTIFNINMYKKYVLCEKQNFYGIVIGRQIRKNGTLRLKPSYPKSGFIDVGNVLAHSGCLEKCEWPETYTKGVNHRDFLFWNSVYIYYEKKCVLWDYVISYYNKLRT